MIVTLVEVCVNLSSSPRVRSSRNFGKVNLRDEGSQGTPSVHRRLDIFETQKLLKFFILKRSRSTDENELQSAGPRLPRAFSSPLALALALALASLVSIVVFFVLQSYFPD